MAPVHARLIAFAMLSAVAVPAGVRAQEASPQMIACHKEATQRYIEDFRQVGLPQNRFDGFPVVVTTFQNDSMRFEEYFAECMQRRDPKKTR